MFKKLVLLLVVVLPISSVFSAPKRVSCPKIIADKSGKTYASSSRYRCFNLASEAKKAGFLSQGSSLSCSVINTSLFSLNGFSNKNTEPFFISKTPAKLKYTHNGDSNFIIRLRNTDASLKDGLVNLIGTANGETYIYTKGTFYFDITADGNWNIEVVQ